MTKYGKKILYNYSAWWNGEFVECFILKSKQKDYIDIHVIHPRFRDDEMNTLQFQEPKEYLKNYTSDVKCDCVIIQFMLWYKHSTNDDVISFSVDAYDGNGEKI